MTRTPAFLRDWSGRCGARWPSLPIVLAVLLTCSVVSVSGCSRFGPAAQAVERGDALMAAGKVDEAALDYIKALVPGQRQASLIARLGAIYAEQGLVLRARELLGEAVEALPGDFELRHKFAQARLALGEVVGARADALEILRGRPDHSEAPVLLANASRTPALEVEARRELESLPALLRGRAPVLTALAILACRAGDLDSADAHLRRAVTLDPNYAPAHEAYADYWTKANRPDRAAAELRAAAESAPLRSPHVLRWFWHQMEAKDYPGARATVERVLKTHPVFPPALLAMAFVNARQQRADEALQFAERGLDAEVGLPGAYLFAAQLRLQRGEPAAAIIWLNRLQRRYPAIVATHYLLAVAHAAVKEPRLARESLRRAMEIDGALKEIGILAAAVLGEVNSADRVMGLNRAVALWPESAALADALARVDLEAGKLDAAQTRVQAWLDREPRSARAFHLLGRVAIARRDRSAAVDFWQRALLADPDYVPASLDLADLHFQSGCAAEADETVARLLRRQPHLPEAMLQRAILLEHAGKFEAARDLYQQVVDRNDTAGVAFNNLAWLVAEKFHDFGRALVLARRARELMPQSANVADTLGWIYYLRGEYRLALPLLEKSAEETPDSAESQFRLGQVQAKLGDAAAAGRNLQRALELGLAADSANQARRLLAELAQ
jgi:tetratricopeptide (TPR) repeat protein